MAEEEKEKIEALEHTIGELKQEEEEAEERKQKEAHERRVEKRIRKAADHWFG